MVITISLQKFCPKPKNPGKKDRNINIDKDGQLKLEELGEFDIKC